MSAKYFAILTNQGAALLANATALGTQLNLTQLSVGDANGVLPTPDPAQTKLINQRRIKPLNQLSVDPANPGQIIAEQIIPENEGGFWIREIGLFDDSGVLIAVANCPETYKPLLQEGSGRTQTIRMVLIVSSTTAVTLKVDPSVVLATRKYADDKAIEVKAYADDLMIKHLAEANPHPKYATIASPTFTGAPKSPTPPVVANDTRIATAEFVQAVIAALVSGDLANKQPLDKTLTDLSGKDAAAILEYLGLGDVQLALKYGAPLIGELIMWSRPEMPQEWWPDMKMEFIPYMAQTFDTAKYPLLASIHSGGVLSADMRGMFPRGWDNTRGVDPGRGIMMEQGDAIRNFAGSFGNFKAISSISMSGPFVTGTTTGVSNDSDGGTGPSSVSFDPSRVVPTANENRPKNVAWNMIVRAK